jgi:hypothetical protein
LSKDTSDTGSATSRQLLEAMLREAKVACEATKGKQAQNVAARVFHRILTNTLSGLDTPALFDGVPAPKQKRSRAAKKPEEPKAGQDKVQVAKAACDYFCTRYELVHGTLHAGDDRGAGRYGGIIRTRINWILQKIDGSLDRFKKVVDAYLACDERFYAGHPITKLASHDHLPKFASAVAEQPSHGLGRVGKLTQEDRDAINEIYDESDNARLEMAARGWPGKEAA